MEETLRDKIAISVVTAISQDFWNFKRDDSDYKRVAESAYKIADAMLTQRNKEQDQ